MTRLSLLPLAIAAIALTGCSAPVAPSLASVAPAQIPTGWQLQNAEKYGISIGIPPGWKVASGDYADPKSALAGSGADLPNGPTGNTDLDNMVKGMDEENKKKEAAALAELEAEGIIIHAITTGTRPVFGETPTHFSVKISPNVSATLAGAAEAAREHVPGEEAPVPAKIPAGPAMVIRALKKMRDGGEVTSIKYVLQDGKTTIVVAFVTEADGSTIKQIEQPVIETLRIVPGKAVAPVPQKA